MSSASPGAGRPRRGWRPPWRGGATAEGWGGTPGRGRAGHGGVGRPGSRRRGGRSPGEGWAGRHGGAAGAVLLGAGQRPGSGRAGRADGGAAGVRTAVVAEGAGPRAPAAPLQHARVEVGVAARVLRQVVAAHEALLADGAAELLLAGVCAVVPRQLIGARKLLVAVLPAAGKGPLTCGRQGRASAPAPDPALHESPFLPPHP